MIMMTQMTKILNITQITEITNMTERTTRLYEFDCNIICETIKQFMYIAHLANMKGS